MWRIKLPLVDNCAFSFGINLCGLTIQIAVEESIAGKRKLEEHIQMVEVFFFFSFLFGVEVFFLISLLLDYND